jgi:membrane-bound metal-dependent hydrolase YbcI (DUF457 family)
MFFLGHMCWAYVFGRGASYLTRGRTRFQLLLLCGVLPDVDLLLRIEHGGITHSIAFGIIAFAPVFLWIGLRRGLPYLIAMIQHPLFGDFIANRYKSLLPFSNRGYGFRLGLTSPISLSIEVLGFLSFLTFAYIAKDLMPLFLRKPVNLLSSLPAAAMLASFVTVYAPADFEVFQALFLLLLISSSSMGVVGTLAETPHDRGL